MKPVSSTQLGVRLFVSNGEVRMLKDRIDLAISYIEQEIEHRKLYPDSITGIHELEWIIACLKDELK